MRLNADTVGRIKACKGVYSIGDTARHFHCSKSTVHDIWNGKRHTNIAEASEPDNVATSRVAREVIEEETRILSQRGYSLNETANAIGVSESTIRRAVDVQWFYSF